MPKRTPIHRRIAVPERGASGRRPPKHACKALVRLDTARVRARLLKDRAAAEKALSKAEAEWRQYVEVDQPAYRRWVHAVGGPLRSDVERMQGELGQLQYLMGAIGNICDLSDVPVERYLKDLVVFVRMTSQQTLDDLARLTVAEWIPHLQAFLAKEAERIRAQMDDGQNGGADAFDEDDVVWDGSDGSDDDEDDPIDDEDLDEAFGRMDENLRDTLRGFLGLPSPARREPSRSVRDLYRELCRKLHPDAAGEMTTARRALWDQVQEAYAERDVQTLEALLARVELEVEPASAAHAAPSRLLALIQHLKDGLRSVQALLRQGRRDVAWGFPAWTEAKRRRFHDAILQELDVARHAVQDELQDHRREFLRQIGKALRTQQPRRGPKKPTTRDHAGQTVFDFLQADTPR